MRLSVLILLLCAFFLTSCANEGVIVQKDSRPHPFYDSIGVEGVFTFTLRDRAGAMHRQMVTPDVFERYAIGEYFNDLQGEPSHGDAKDVRAVATPVRPVYRPDTITRGPAPTRAVAAKSAKTPSTKKSIASRTAKKSLAGRSTTKKSIAKRTSSTKKSIAHHTAKGSSKTVVKRSVKNSVASKKSSAKRGTKKAIAKKSAPKLLQPVATLRGEPEVMVSTVR